MHEDRSCPCPDDGGDRPTTVEEDAKVERYVLHAVLAVYPELYTKGELAREYLGKPENFATRDAIEQAVESLSAIGLLHCSGPLVVPSRGALRFDILSSRSG